MVDLIAFSERAARLRDRLTKHLMWTPHDCIREPKWFLDADRQRYVDLLLRDIPFSDDLRFLYKSQLALLAERLPWDSDFFGYDVARFHGIFPLSPDESEYVGALRLWLDRLRERGIKYLFGSVRPEDLALIQAMCACGFTLIETRVIYHRPLSDFNHSPRYPVRLATKEDLLSLSETAQKAINQFDRFHADPFILASDTDRLMAKWIEASILDDFADFTVIPDLSNPNAFITVRALRSEWANWQYKLSQLVLVAILPSYTGWFTRLASETCYLLREIGAEHVFITTQLTNRPLIHACEKLGFRYGRGEHIFRLVL